MPFDVIEYISRNREKLFDFAVSICLDHNELLAEEIMDHLLVKASREHESIQSKSWVEKVIRNKNIDIYRRESKKREKIPLMSYEEIVEKGLEYILIEKDQFDLDKEDLERIVEKVRTVFATFIKSKFKRHKRTTYLSYLDLYFEKRLNDLTWEQMQQRYKSINMNVVRIRIESLFEEFVKYYRRLE